MTKAHIFTPENRLARILVEKDALTRGQLVEAAEARLEEMAPSIWSEVNRLVRRIGASAALEDEAIRAIAPDLVRDAIGIANIAVSAELAALGEVARGFAVLMDSCAREGVWRRDVYRLHLDALRLVEAQRGDVGVYRKMIADLSQVRSAIGVGD